MTLLNTADKVMLNGQAVSRIYIGIHKVFQGYVDPLAQVIAMFATGDPGMVYVPDVPSALHVRRNMLINSEPNATQVPGNNAPVATTSIAGFDVSRQFGDASVTRDVLRSSSVPATNLAGGYVLSVYVQMDDGGVPVYGTVADADFSFYVLGIPAGLGGIIDVGGGVYRVYSQGHGTGGTNGIRKWTTNSNRGFRVSGFQLEAGAVPTDYQKVTDWNTEYAAATALTATMWQDAAGAVPVTAVEQVIGLHLDRSQGLALGPERLTADPGFEAGAAVTVDWGAAVGTSGFNTVDPISGTTDYVIDITTGANGARPSFVWPGPVIEVGKTYQFSFDYKVISGIVGLSLVYIGGTVATATGKIISGTGRATFTARATGTNGSVGLYFANGVGKLQIDNLSYKEVPGNHRNQTTTAAKPKLTARVNLFTQTENVSVAPWGTGSAGTRTASAYTALDGTLAGSFFETTANAQHRFDAPPVYLYPGTKYVYRLRLKLLGRGVEITVGNTVLANSNIRLDLNGVHLSTVTGTYGTIHSTTSVPLGNNEHEITIVHTTATGAAAGNTVPTFYLTEAGAYSYAGDITKGMYLWRPQYEVGAVAGPYQRVVTATDYDAVGFPHRIKYDGFDDFLVSNSVDFTMTDKVTVWWGGTLFNQAFGTVYEFGSSIAANAGTFAQFNGVTSSKHYPTASRGDAAILSYAGFASSTQPDTCVLTASHDIAGDLSRLRRNGVVGIDYLSDQGTGNFISAPMYFGRRNGTASPGNFEESCLVIKGKATTAAQITTGETLAASLTGVTLA